MGPLMKSPFTRSPLFKPLLLAAAIAVLTAWLTPAQAAQPTGAAMAHTCAGCHGTQGKLGRVEFVPLAGMAETEFKRAMLDFRAGKRASTLMGHVANGFSDSEIDAMARYFASVK
jgi:sulfide dehydrogenase cytochrome subunit